MLPFLLLFQSTSGTDCFSAIQKMQVSAVNSPSPSFSSYSNSNLAEVASRVVQVDKQERTTIPRVYEAGTAENEEEVEFAFQSLPPVSADEIFHNGMIRPVYPSFLLGNTRYHGSVDESKLNSGLLKGVKLRKLFNEERETSTTSSCSSSEADELEGVSAKMYCVWKSKPAVGRLKKSSSTGWMFKGFLQKTQSVGSNSSFAIASQEYNGRRKRDECVIESPVIQQGVCKDDILCSSSSRTAGKCNPPPYKQDYGEKLRSYSQYRHDLVGFFANVNKLSKNFHPF